MNELTPAEEEKYLELKAQLVAELEIISTAFARAGRILKTIRDEQLYRREFSSFERFCKKTFSRGRDYAYKLIAAYDLVQELMEEGVQKRYLPQSERLSRELSQYPKSDRARIAKRAHQMAISEGKETPEVQHIREAGAEMTERGKARLIRALIDKLRGIERSLPDAIEWDPLNQLQRFEVMTLLARIEEHASALIVQAQQPPTVDVQAEVKPAPRRASAREVPPEE